MKSPIGKLSMLVALALVALATVGASVASAHDRGRGGHLGGLRVSASALAAEAAKQLGVTPAKLKGAIADAAVARITEAAEDGDIDADDAADMKEEARDNLRYAYGVSTTRTVAANLGITAVRLNTGFRAARKALLVARIDEAVEDGDLEADDAAELKADLDDDLPGYKGGGRGFGGGHRGFGR